MLCSGVRTRLDTELPDPLVFREPICGREGRKGGGNGGKVENGRDGVPTSSFFLQFRPITTAQQ